MLSSRAKILLKTLMEIYLGDGQPVGSRTLSKRCGLDVSPATIRNIMADLEDLGLVTSPHTSAGRVPTPQGYRIFIDTLLTVQPLEQEDLQQLKQFLHPDDPHRLITSASQLLSELTRFAAVVMKPRRNPAFRQVEFIKLSKQRILLIIIATDGNVQNRILLTDKEYSESELTQAANFFNQHYAGHTFEQVRRKIYAEMKKLRHDMTALMTKALDASRDALENQQDDYVLFGEHKLLQNALLSNISILRKLFDLFEEKNLLLRLLDHSQNAEGIKIFIGGESSQMPMSEYSIITAPYEVDGAVAGTLGVIGPTCMAYNRVIPIVDITAKMLSSALSQH